jgi:hypothetical protein
MGESITLTEIVPAVAPVGVTVIELVVDAPDQPPGMIH